ncbi:MalY/PatB family protein [Ureibacillus acetophenoni]|uniref:cysteine-S-conjugate beta-lyase n=1 Tax=Ureibacillus acetophenoni TaxID=614649 RepID=A0A285UT29_9BACL|nr:MalY/PatB family protein [Ureibacillus acetophenoni]SOC44969.1 cystathione beta-lyase [Ureibacillus acetophenoni]
MKYNFDEVVNRRNTNSLKWDGVDLIKQIGYTERYDEETIPLFTADMDFPVSQAIVDALHRTVDQRIYGYSIIPDAYYKSIQQWFKKKYDWDIQKDEIVYSPGTIHAINIAIRAFTEPGDGIIIQRPVYPPFTAAIESNGRQVRNNALNCDDSGYYSIDFEDFEKKAKEENTKMFILCNPHNPTGRVFTKDELAKLSEICARHHVLIVADEIHGDLIRCGQTFIPITKVAGSQEGIITFTAINKTFNTAGLHCTNAIIQESNLRNKFITTMGMHLPSPFTIAALIAAYNDGEEWLNQLIEYIDDTMEWIVNFLADRMPDVKVRIPEGTYVMWMDFSGYGISPEEIHDRIYNKANVLLQDGKVFGEEGLMFQRICVPSPRQILKEAFERIAREFEDLNTKKREKEFAK